MIIAASIPTAICLTFLVVCGLLGVVMGVFWIINPPGDS